MTDLRLALALVRAFLTDHDLVPNARGKALVAFEVVAEYLTELDSALAQATHDRDTWRDYYTAADQLRRDTEAQLKDVLKHSAP